jgi:hypothetical protein
VRLREAPEPGDSNFLPVTARTISCHLSFWHPPHRVTIEAVTVVFNGAEAAVHVDGKRAGGWPGVSASDSLQLVRDSSTQGRMRRLSARSVALVSPASESSVAAVGSTD